MEIDAIVAGMTANEEREEGIDFHNPVFRKRNGHDRTEGFRSRFLYRYSAVLRPQSHRPEKHQLRYRHRSDRRRYPRRSKSTLSGADSGSGSPEKPKRLPLSFRLPKVSCRLNPDLTYITFEDGKGFDVDTSVSIGLKNNTRDTESFKAVQDALDKITTEERESMMQDAVLNAPTTGE